MWYSLCICRIHQNLVVDLVLVLGAIVEMADRGWKAMKGQEWYPYNYDKNKIMVLPEEPRLVRPGASGVEMCECGRPEVRPRYRKKFSQREMFIEYVRLEWCQYLACGSHSKIITLLE